MRSLVLVVRFLLELALVAAVGWSAWMLSDGVWRWVLALAVPALVVVLWARYLSPKAAVELPPQARFALELLLFAVAAVFLSSAGASAAAATLAAVWVVHRVALALTDDVRSPLEG